MECINVGGCLAYGDFAIESGTDFLSVVEHKLDLPRTRSVSHELTE